MLSPVDSMENSLCAYDSHITGSMLLHHLVKCENMKMLPIFFTLKVKINILTKM